MKKFIKISCCFSSVLSVVYYLLIGYFYFTVPSQFTGYVGEEFSVNSISALSFEPSNTALSVSTENSKKISVKLLGVFPVKETTLNLTSEKLVIPGGNAFGIKFLSRGVLVGSLAGVSENGSVSPAEKAGVKMGDYIISINGKEVSSNSDVVNAVNASGGAPLELLVLREHEKIKLTVNPVLSPDGSYKIGVWVKDSAAGIGTLTFSLPEEGVFAGLGHPVTDGSTGQIISLSSGEITAAEIFGITKGKKGLPGELLGRLSGGDIGILSLNCQCGVFGKLLSTPEGEKIPLAFKQNVSKGKAEIITTLDENGPKRYEIEIEKVNVGDKSLTKNMVIRITDSRLINKTGGIVQGMSGSPIIQNGKLVGAVTHVLVDDPTRGFGIFAENMLETAKSITELKEAG